ncbi:transcription-repair coupling factor [Marispirochaeta aestuarii]|uniref:transcription-repair coupling factor n=1 Tax=Marispirochaeta aestuarii TaxID=1963862 RepID=UPI0037493EBB
MVTLFLESTLEKLKSSRPYAEFMRHSGREEYPIRTYGPRGSFLAVVLAALMRQKKRTILCVVPSEKEAENLLRDCISFGVPAVHFPWWQSAPYSEQPTHSNVAARRISILKNLLTGEKGVICVSLRGYIGFLPPRKLLEENLIPLKKGESFDPQKIEQTLEHWGYLRVPRVSSPGEFALRGEVLDVGIPGGDGEALRVVFEFDEIEEIRTFDALTQSSYGSLEEYSLFPATEFLWEEDAMERVEEFMRSRRYPGKGDEEFLEHLRVSRSCAFDEIFFPLGFEKPATLADYMPADGLSLFISDKRLENAAEGVNKEFDELYRRTVREKKLSFPPPDRILASYPDLVEGCRRKIMFQSLKDQEADLTVPEIVCQDPRSFFGNIQYLKEELEQYAKSGYQVYICAETETQSERISQLLKDYEVHLFSAHLSQGFVLPEAKIILIQENEIFGRRKRVPSSVKKARSRAIDTFVELSPGDFVVHVNYGIGRFKGIERIRAAGTERDYIQLEYAGDETVFIPIEQVNLVQRYIGQEGRPPALDSLGGKSWEKRKNRVRQSVEDLADMLIDLYAKRQNAQGFSYGEDTDWQVEFEAAFPYEETTDQLSCIADVKEDMESTRPMDRLICGDVGYGKTEVAMRAAFKAVMAGKQVAILAPTTILTEQHYESFCERFDKYPVTIRMISRFVHGKEQKQTLKQLSEGEVDILIGTHRILQKDVVFKNLGLIIVDEEQRFGVKDKERLKQLKHTVDALALSATPIPRTLHMSLLKIRDMSLLTTPPHNRQSVDTYIREFDEEMVAAAIRRELERGGQVFYLHNRVETLRETRMFLERLVPEALVETAHGQMSSAELEEVMHRFIHGAFQVLVATTIIENGIDISNVNTIIIDRADVYGISQLYQLRGRVGRSERKAYAYLLYPADKALSEIAMKRLQILSDYSDLGAGFKIAMKDMEVRGAGNLLGRQQSGEIASVGFDMYLRLLDEAVAERSEKGEETREEIFLELDYSGYIPDSYISEPVEKMEVYKKIAAIDSDEELEKVHAELHDRFGPLPEAAASLLSLAEVRIVCRKLRVRSLRERGGKVRVEFGKVSLISVDKVLSLMQTSGGKIKPDPKNPNVLLLETGSIGLKEKSEFIRERLSALL